MQILKIYKYFDANEGVIHMKIKNWLIIIAILLICIGIVFSLSHQYNTGKALCTMGSVSAVIAFFIGIKSRNREEEV